MDYCARPEIAVRHETRGTQQLRDKGIQNDCGANALLIMRTLKSMIPVMQPVMQATYTD